eukprot:TRINITY_DN7131_c0_g1_i1.p2 TRINITY_DN7131_c0_g1~~TRINITY_DN7131_c0_g1_i1.p2  ORF type:complete len:140 (-),score=31.24 TRINITY_DN7131_c0_g1_i1:393-812(-)
MWQQQQQGYGAPQQGYGAPQQGGYGAPPPQQQQWYGNYYNQIAPTEMQQLQAWFGSVDRDGSGHITAHEMTGAQYGGAPLRYETAVKLIKVFDRDYSGTIDFYEYASLHKFICAMSHAFIQNDRDRNGTLDSQEILGAL